MSFGKRGQSAARPTADVHTGRKAGVIRPGARRSGYWIALFWACVVFVLSTLVAAAWALAQTETTRLSPVSLALYGVAGAGPVVAASFAVSLAVADALLRVFKVQSVAAYAALVATLSLANLVVPVLLLNPGEGPFYYLLLVLPGATAGGAILGRRRTPEPASTATRAEVRPKLA